MPCQMAAGSAFESHLNVVVASDFPLDLFALLLVLSAMVDIASLNLFHFCNGPCYNWQETIAFYIFHIHPFYWVVGPFQYNGFERKSGGFSS